jgi:Domain of unknown function (DUF1905)
MTGQAFRGEVIVGHKRTHAIIVPFDPSNVWPDGAPVKMSLQDDPRGGSGWPVTGTIEGRPFDGFVGRRYGRSYIVVPTAWLAAGYVKEGDEVDVVIAPRIMQRPG